MIYALVLYTSGRGVYISPVYACMMQGQRKMETIKRKIKTITKKRHRVYTDTQHQANAKVKERILVIGTK